VSNCARGKNLPQSEGSCRAVEKGEGKGRAFCWCVRQDQEGVKKKAREEEKNFGEGALI